MAEGKFKDKISQMLGMSGEDEFEDEYQDEEVQDYERNQPSGVARAAAQSGIETGADVLVLEPEVFDDAPIIVNKIKENRTVVVNLKNTEYEEGRKIFDFLNGAVFALEGSINKISDSVFILAPSEVSVSTEMEKRSDEFVASFLEWDEK